MRSSLPIAVRCRVIVDNDWAGDPDGLVGLAHHLLSPSNRVDLITSSFLAPMFGVDNGTAKGAALAAFTPPPRLGRCRPGSPVRPDSSATQSRT